VNAAIRLGLRLAMGGAGRDRMRAAMVISAGAVGAWVLLTMFAIQHAEGTRTNGTYTGESLRWLLISVVATVAMPVVVLVATTARLSAAVRDRRLAGLRLLGLSPARTRVVAAVESGAVAAVGSLLGLGLFWLIRPVVSGLTVAGRHWSGSSFKPSLTAEILVVVAVPLLAVIVALMPTARLGWRQRSNKTAKGAPRRPTPLRLVPLGAGLILVQAATSGLGEGHVSNTRIYGFMAGSVLCGLGLLIVVPVFTRLLADLLVRLPGRPTLRIAGRRLQAQPAGVSRIVSGLLIGLFLVTGGRMVIGAFEDTTQYRSAEKALKQGPAQYNVQVAKAIDRTKIVAALATVPGVRIAYLNRQVLSGCRNTGPCISGFVGTCHDLQVAVPAAVGCRDDALAWIDDQVHYGAPEAGARMVLRSLDSRGGRAVAVQAPPSSQVITSEAGKYAVGEVIQADLFIPRSTPGVLALSDHAGTSTQIAVLTDPGSSVASRITKAVRLVDASAFVYPAFSSDDYDFVAALRAIVWAVAAVVLAIGLLGFAIATIDRAVSRRQEMVGLQLVGASRRVLRTAQWWEASLPLLLGLPLAIAVGWSAGTSYLALGDSLTARPWQSVLTLAATSIIAATAIAALSVAACAPPIRADHIRRS
jgi:putative ABC transport system permease protein